MILPRSEGVMVAHGPDSRARRAACTAASMSALSPSATCAITLPVAGFVTSKVLPEAAATHLPLINIFFGVARNCVTGVDVGISLRTALIVVSPDVVDARPRRSSATGRVEGYWGKCFRWPRSESA